MDCCGGIPPTKFFHHFTGRSKPWLRNIDIKEALRKDKPLALWMQHLDNLKLSFVNSSTIYKMNLKPSLGFFYPNK
jgi:hypothetical protein